MTDYKSGWPPGPPSQPGAPASGPLPMAPPRSVPPAATPQRIPVPSSGAPVAASVPPRHPSLGPEVGAGKPQEPVDLDSEVMEASDDDEHSEPAMTPAVETAALQPLRPMRRLSIAEPDAASRPSSPPPLPLEDPSEALTPLVAAAALPEAAPAVPAAVVPPPPPASPPPASPPPPPPAPAHDHDRLPSFDDPEHHDDRIGLTPAAPAVLPELEPPPSSSDPDEVDTPVPAAPVHVSAPPPFVPPPSPLLPDFAAVPPLAPPPQAHDLEPAKIPGVAPPAPIVPPPVAEAPAERPSRPPPVAEAPAERPSRPPPVVPDAVVAAIQPGAFQAEHAVFETHAPIDEDEMRLSETDLEISTTGEPPEVSPEMPPAVARAPESSGAPAAPVIEAPIPEVALAGAAQAQAADADAPVSDVRKPPPPKRTAKPALPSAAIRRRPWWETLFGDDFARAHRSPTPRQLAREVNFMVTNLALTQNQVVLDLGCGQGEHSVELTRRGVSVVGYDLSVFQLAMAGDRAQQEGQKINFLQGDMREMAFDSMFDAVICWDTTFGYFEEEKNVDVARRMLLALKPGGSLLIHVMNRDFAAKESPTNIWFEGDGCVCMDDVDFDWITSRLRVKRSLILDDGRSKELHYSVRLYDLSELGKLLHEVGFRVAHVSGDVSTPGAFFGPASPYLVIRAQRP